MRQICTLVLACSLQVNSFCSEVTSLENSDAHKKQQFELVSTTNVGYPQNELPTHVLINGQPNPLYFNVATPGRTRTIHHGSAVEPTIAVNPTNAQNIVACWMQDKANKVGNLTGSIAYTFDGGASWERTEVPYQFCKEDSLGAGDFWLSFANDGTLYLSALVLHEIFDTARHISISVSISHDGGITWSLPVAVSDSTMTIHQSVASKKQPSIIADPNNPLRIYVVWDMSIPTADSWYVPTFWSYTTDGGKTWSHDTVSYAGQTWQSLGSLLYDPFVDLCAQGLSTCDRNFHSAWSGVSGDNATSTIGNIIVVLPKAQPGDALWQEDTWGDEPHKEQRLSGDLLNFMDRDLYPACDATLTHYVHDKGLITFFYRKNDMAVVRSQDQGAHWNVTAKVVVPNTDYRGNAGAVYVAPKVYTGGYTYDAHGNPIFGKGTLLRTGDTTASYAVNPKNGFLYCVYQTGQFRSDFLPQIGITTSRDGGYTWSERVRINRTSQDVPNPQAFRPSVAVTEDGYVGILYHDFRMDTVQVPHESSSTKTDAWLAIYKEVEEPGDTGIGLSFVQEIRLSKNSYIAQNGPITTDGVMTNGDYSFLVANKHNFYAAFTQSHNGPFTPSTIFFEDPSSGTTILLDDNYRQSPFVSVVKHVKKGDH